VERFLWTDREDVMRKSMLDLAYEHGDWIDDE